MNYLVHFLLSGDDDELRLGNLLGDFVKGRVERWAHPGLTERLRIGIQMHRTIDAFSDCHPAVHRSKRILAPAYGRLSGVIVDVFYDHALARRWPDGRASVTRRTGAPGRSSPSMQQGAPAPPAVRLDDLVSFPPSS
jgi:acyl carrier protein phosphodiesterase